MPAVSNSTDLDCEFRSTDGGISGKFTVMKRIRIVQGWWSEVRDVALIFIKSEPLLCSFAIFVLDALAGIL